MFLDALQCCTVYTFINKNREEKKMLIAASDVAKQFKFE